MKRLALFVSFLLLGSASGASALDTKVFRDLLVVDSAGRKVGAVADGSASDAEIFVLAETQRRVFLLGMFKSGFVAEGTVRYTGAGCTGEAYVGGVSNAEGSFLEKAQIGAAPGTSDLWAFLIDRSTEPAEVNLASYWYEGACVDAVLTATAYRLRLAKNLSFFTAPFAVTIYGHEATRSDRRP